MIYKDLFRRFLVGFYVLAFSALLFGFTRYSYRAKELLVCWLFFLFVLCRSYPDAIRRGARCLCGPVFSEVVERGETRHPGARGSVRRSSPTVGYRPTNPGRSDPQVLGRLLQACGRTRFRCLSLDRARALSGEASF